MILPEERKLLLRDKFFQFTFKGQQPDEAFFVTINNPIEYHYIVDMYNWDDGVEVLSWIINSTTCDKGTAKMIFWRSQPSYYTKFLTAEEADWAADVFKLLKTIIDNFDRHFYKSESILYDPTGDLSAEDINYKDSKAKWDIPEFMKEPTKGEDIFFE